MSRATDADRQHWALAGLMLSKKGPEYVRDAISDELVREMAELIKCGDDLAAIAAFKRGMLADRDISRAIEAEHERSDAQIEMELRAEVLESAPSWWKHYDRDTAIAVRGEI